MVINKNFQINRRRTNLNRNVMGTAVAIAMALGLNACDQAKVVSREMTNDKCSVSEIAARMQELGADQMDSLAGMSSDSMDSVNRMSEQTNRFASASARINAAIMRNDLDTACRLLDQLEADMGKNKAQP